MIQDFVERWEQRKGEVEAAFAEKHPEEYVDIVRAVVRMLNPEGTYGAPDPERIHVIDDGHYQGTLVFVIAEGGDQPDRYWYVRVGYGSCSGCDTLLGISPYSTDTPPTPGQVKDYMTLALHIVQGLRAMDDDVA